VVNIILDAVKPILRIVAGPLTAIAIVILAAMAGGDWPALLDPLRSRPGPIVYDPSIATDLAEVPGTLLAPRPPLGAPESSAPASDAITTCAAYLLRLELGALPMQARGSPAYADCPVIALLRRSSLPTMYLASEERLGHAILGRLNPAGLSRASPLPGAAARRLADLPADRVEVSGRHITLGLGTQIWTLEVVASADLTGDGREDPVARITNLDGQRHYRALLPDKAGALSAVPPDDLLIDSLHSGHVRLMH
jgi:hypothetical protein